MTFLHNAGKFDSQVSTWLHHSPTGFMSLSRVQRMTLQPARPAGIASSLACVSQGAGGFVAEGFELVTWSAVAKTVLLLVPAEKERLQI